MLNIKRYVKFTIAIFLRDGSREKTKVSEERTVGRTCIVTVINGEGQERSRATSLTLA